MSSLRVPDARRAARPTLGVTGTSTPTRSTARSRPRSASSRRCGTCEFPPRPRRPARRATAPRRRRWLDNNQIDGPIPKQIGLLAALTDLRVPPASPTPGAPRERASASQVPREQQQDLRHVPGRALQRRALPRQGGQPRARRAVRHGQLLRYRKAFVCGHDLRQVLRSRDDDVSAQLEQDRRPDPGRDRPAHGADVPASSPRVSDARRAARPPLGVAGTSTTTRSMARSRARSASSRR